MDKGLKQKAKGRRQKAVKDKKTRLAVASIRRD
jgi:hypothetical protein